MPHWTLTLIVATLAVGGCFVRLGRDRKYRREVVSPPRKFPVAVAVLFGTWSVCATFIWILHSRGLPIPALFLLIFAVLSVAVVVSAYSLFKQRHRTV
jgi:ABC-type xylose transport system permease subunit